MRSKWLFVLICSALLSVMITFGAFASEYGTYIDGGECGATEVDDLNWAVYDNDGDTVPDVFVISGTGAMEDYVNDVAPWYDEYRENMMSLVLENGVTNIGERAFIGCTGFTGELKIPESVVRIGASAFAVCSGLTGDLIIPNSVTTLGGEAFGMCGGFDGKLVLSSNINIIEAYTFVWCDSLKGDLVIPESVTKICNTAFSGCSSLGGD